MDNKEYRSWGSYTVLDDYGTIKIKELQVDPGKCLSLQKHLKRNEFWVVREGIATIYHGYDKDNLSLTVLNPNQTIILPILSWHKLCNATKSYLSIIEVQFGSECIEEDILRAD